MQLMWVIQEDDGPEDRKDHGDEKDLNKNHSIFSWNYWLYCHWENSRFK